METQAKYWEIASIFGEVGVVFWIMEVLMVIKGWRGFGIRMGLGAKRDNWADLGRSIMEYHNDTTLH